MFGHVGSCTACVRRVSACLWRALTVLGGFVFWQSCVHNSSSGLKHVLNRKHGGRCWSLPKYYKTFCSHLHDIKIIITLDLTRPPCCLRVSLAAPILADIKLWLHCSWQLQPTSSSRVGVVASSSVMQLDNPSTKLKFMQLVFALEPSGPAARPCCVFQVLRKVTHSNFFWKLRRTTSLVPSSCPEITNKVIIMAGASCSPFSPGDNSLTVQQRPTTLQISLYHGLCGGTRSCRRDWVQALGLRAPMEDIALCFFFFF